MKYLLLGLVMFVVVMMVVVNNDCDVVNQIFNVLYYSVFIVDFEQYFGLYYDSVIFIGIDVFEVWIKEVFKVYVKFYFDKGRGWIYYL